MDNYTRLANQIINEAMTCSKIEDEEITDSEIIKFAHELGIEEELILSPDGDLINRDEMLERISEEEDAEEEPHAKDTDDATHKGGKLYQGGHQFRKRQSSERARLRGKRVYNPETGEYEMPEDEEGSIPVRKLSELSGDERRAFDVYSLFERQKEPGRKDLKYFLFNDKGQYLAAFKDQDEAYKYLDEAETHDFAYVSDPVLIHFDISAMDVNDLDLEDELDNYRIKSEDGEGLSEKDLKTIMTVKKLAGGDAKGGIFSNPEKDIQKAYGAMLTKISKQVQNIAKNI